MGGTSGQIDESASSGPSFLEGGGVAGATARAVDWSQTALGPVESWPHSLRTTVGMLLHSRHPMFLWWGPELIQFYNDGYLPSFGMGKHPAAMGQRGADCWGEIWSLIGPQIDDVMKRGKPSWNEEQLVPILRNGRLEEVYWTYGYSPVFDDAGEVGGTLVVCTEVTSKVQSQRRLRALQQLTQRTRAAQTPQAVFDAALLALADQQHDLPFALFYRADIRGGLSLAASRGLRSEERDQLAAFVESAALASGPGHVHELPEGRRAVFLPLSSASGLPVGYALLGIHPLLSYDATYREFSSELTNVLGQALAEAEGLVASRIVALERNNLLQQAPVGAVLMTGPEHRFELANRLYCQIVGRDDLVGKTYREAFPELIGTGLPEVLDNVYRTGTPFVTEELPVALDLRGDGVLVERFFKFNLEPIRNVLGEVQGMLGIAVDITEQVAARKRLEQADVERSKLLLDLELANRAKDEFLAMLGHELRNPLAPIVTAVQLMKLQEPAAVTREREIIERQVQHVVRLVDDLLDISKITRGKVNLRRSRVALASVLRSAVEASSQLLETRRHTLTVDVPDGLAWEGDADRLAQVVSNLLTNAARYTEPGGTIRLRAARERDEIIITVEDSGIGIERDKLLSIFDIFVQGQRSTERAEGGLGIGLALVKNLVHMHAGSVTADSPGLGQGSTFTVRLPAPRDGSEARDSEIPSPPTGERTRHPQRILVVDDNADAADLLSAWLRRLGHTVQIAEDPLLALKLASSFRPQLALLDIGLPVMDGYELGEKLRALLAPAPLRLIALTGYGQAHDRARSTAAGFERHFTKPVELSQLKRLLEAPPVVRG